MAPQLHRCRLVTNALTEDIVVHTATGTRTQQWLYPGPLDCCAAIRPWPITCLGVKTRQLNGNLAYAGTGVTDNQLRAWNHIGLFDATLDESKCHQLRQARHRHRHKCAPVDASRPILSGCQLRPVPSAGRRARVLGCALRHAARKPEHHQRGVLPMILAFPAQRRFCRRIFPSLSCICA